MHSGTGGVKISSSMGMYCDAKAVRDLLEFKIYQSGTGTYRNPKYTKAVFVFAFAQPYRTPKGTRERNEI